MPFIHKYACANPIECPKADKQLKFRNKITKNWNAKYMFATYLKMHMHIEHNYWMW